MKHIAWEAFRYSMAAGVALVVDMGLLWLLVEKFGWYYLAAATASFIAGSVIVYVLSVAFVFRHRSVEDRRVEFGVFFAIGVIGVLINLAVMKVAVDGFGLYYMVAKLVSVFFTFTANFGLRRVLLFTPRSPGA